jgi:hypothetical protein
MEPGQYERKERAMRQDKVYRVESPGGKDFYFIVNGTESGIVIFILGEEPSKHTEEEQASAVVQLQVEPSPEATRVLARLWDDETGKEANSTHSITLVEQEPDQQ